MIERRRLLVVLFLGLAASCVPYKNPPLGEIAELASLRDVMDAQATIAEPLWSRIGEPSFEGKDWATFRDASERLRATATRAKTIGGQQGKPPRFAELADRLATAAASLGKATEAKDRDLTSQALSDMKSTCKACHSEFR